MKQIITILLFAALYINSKAQCNLPYKPLTEFGTDTVAFMTYNFRDRADWYKGKTLKEIAHDLQIPIKDFQTSYVSRSNETENIDGINIYIYTAGLTRRLMLNRKTFNSIYIEWENKDSLNDYYKQSENGWTQEVFDYLKDKKIKHIRYTDRIRKPVRSRPL